MKSSLLDEDGKGVKNKIQGVKKWLHMVSRKSLQRQKKNSIKGVLIGVVLIPVLVLTMIMLLEELSRAQGDYRRTLWDRISGSPAPPQGQAEVSLQVAQEICRQEVARRLGGELIRASFDSRSSRYNPSYQVHTVFLNVEVSGREREDIYARCDISAVQRQILEFRLHGYSGGFLWG